MKIQWKVVIGVLLIGSATYDLFGLNWYQINRYFGLMVFPPKEVTIADSGDGSAAASTLTTPERRAYEYTCSDSDGCTITLGETNVFDGQWLTIHNTGSNTITLSDSSGVQELSATFAMVQYQYLSLEYQSDRWVEVSRSVAPSGEATSGDSATNFFTTGQFAKERMPSVSWVRALHSTTQTLTDNTLTAILFDAESHDTDTYHFLLATAITGTVAKTAASVAIVGTGTAFTTELAVRQAISIPGTAAEICVVATITDDTNLTCYQTMANNATGQTATRVNSIIAAPFTGVYFLTCTVGLAVDTTASQRFIGVRVNGTDYVGIETLSQTVSASVGNVISASGYYPLTAGNYVECIVRHVSGGNLDTIRNSNEVPMFQMAYVGQ